MIAKTNEMALLRHAPIKVVRFEIRSLYRHHLLETSYLGDDLLVDSI